MFFYWLTSTGFMIFPGGWCCYGEALNSIMLYVQIAHTTLVWFCQYPIPNHPLLLKCYEICQYQEKHSHAMMFPDFTITTYYGVVTIFQLGYRCKLLVFIFGSLGHVHKLVVRGLQMAGLSKRRAKQLAKYCSVSAIIGSRSIWRRRCFLYP